jgi:RimJ/RimL family protein N-acetyltransferase
MKVELREVQAADLPVLFEHQADPVAADMAAFPSREREAFMEHWERILANETGFIRAVAADGRLAGYVLSFERDGEREVGYWMGREFWGAGIATAALAAFLEVETTRPLHAGVARHNVGSLRVLEKCGFAVRGHDGDHVVLRLD